MTNTQKQNLLNFFKSDNNFCPYKIVECIMNENFLYKLFLEIKHVHTLNVGLILNIVFGLTYFLERLVFLNKALYS